MTPNYAMHRSSRVSTPPLIADVRQPRLPSMRSARIYRLGTAAIMLAAPSAALSSPTYEWCAPPRIEEPLLKEGVTLGTSQEERAVNQRRILNLPLLSHEAIAIVSEEDICRDAAKAYWSILRESVATEFSDHPDTAVLVVRVGTFYLVDDLRKRDGYWEVMIFDKSWKRLYGYGEGA
jgi:hypothetical protein